MRKMKKVMAVMLAATMAMSMSLTAFATDDGFTGGYDKDGKAIVKDQQPSTDDGGNKTYVDTASVDLKKVYKLITSDTTSPAESFSFTIDTSNAVISDSQYTSSNVPYPYFGMKNDQKVYTTTINFAEGDATVDGKTETAKIYLPTYDEVGIFTYTITESEPEKKTAGVEYGVNTRTLLLKVTAIRQGGIVRVAAIHLENEDGSKSENILNTYGAGSLAVTKTVSGNMGDQTQNFEVVVTFTAPTNENVSAPIYYNDDLNTGENSKTLDWNTSTGTTETTITLHHDETVTFTNIPEGVTYTVVEKDYTNNATDSKYKLGYDAAKYENSDNDTTNTGSGTISYVYDKTDSTKIVSVDTDTVSINNNKGTDVDTGINLDNAPYILLLAIAALGMFGFVSKKRSSEF